MKLYIECVSENKSKSKICFLNSRHSVDGLSAYEAHPFS